MEVIDKIFVFEFPDCETVAPIRLGEAKVPHTAHSSTMKAQKNFNTFIQVTMFWQTISQIF